MFKVNNRNTVPSFGSNNGSLKLHYFETIKYPFYDKPPISLWNLARLKKSFISYFSEICKRALIQINFLH